MSELRRRLIILLVYTADKQCLNFHTLNSLCHTYDINPSYKTDISHSIIEQENGLLDVAHCQGFKLFCMGLLN